MHGNSKINRWGAIAGSIAAVVVVLVFATDSFSWLARQSTGIDAHFLTQAVADERYVLKGELKETMDGLNDTMSAAGVERTRLNIESAIGDLEDDIEWFGERQDADAAQRRCRKLVRKTREWQAITLRSWESDPIIRRVCEG